VKKKRGRISPNGRSPAFKRKNRAKPSPAAGDFLFEIDSEPLDECVTALDGVPRLARGWRRFTNWQQALRLLPLPAPS
jgi:hypothetical protein